MKKVWVLTFIVLLVSLSCDNNIVGDSSDYRIDVEIESSNTVNINGYVYDENYEFVENAVISIDGEQLVKQSSDNYYVYINELWADESTHTFSVSTPDGNSATGSISKPTGSLTGFTVNPSSNQGVNTYTVSPPSGSWPVGSYVECYYTNGGTNYLISEYPSGSTDVIFSNTRLGSASDIYISCAFQNRVSVDNYSATSIISITGPYTSW